MNQTIVNIITEDEPIANYLFVKEMYRSGDRLMFISARDTEDEIDFFSELLNIPDCLIDEVVLKKDSDEIAYERMCRTIMEYLKPDVKYVVNLSGGSKFMALTVRQVFEKYNSEFYYLSRENNVIVHSKFDHNIYNGDDFFYPVKYRMGIAEYIQTHEMEYKLGAPTKSEEYSKHLFTLFTEHYLSNRDFRLLDILRENYRNRRRTVIAQAENPSSKAIEPAYGLQAFLTFIGFPLSQDGVLSREEVQYLTGGWFEEYVYYFIKREVEPNDIALGVDIFRKGVNHKNELDVVFTRGNKLFVIECKTGVQTNRMFNEIVYKACALKEALLGVACHSYIFSLKADMGGDLKKIADNMEITFCDHESLMNPLLMNKHMKRMKELALD